jgi:3',5'-cyclic AMP phosphodiesterase CpdA
MMTVGESTQAFSWVQFSDPHFTVPKPTAKHLLGKRLLGFLSWQKRRRFNHLPAILDLAVQDARAQDPDHWLVTGDLTHIGLPDEYRQARRWLQKLGKASQVSVVPGNHETYATAPWETTQMEWQNWMSSDRSVSMGKVGQDYYPFVRRRGPVAFVGVSSAVCTAPLLATGRVGQGQLARLAELLEQLKQEGLLRVIMIHHPPQDGAVRPRKRLLDAAAFKAVIAEHGAELILHGHAHHWCRATLASEQRSVLVLGPPSTTADHHEFGAPGTAGYYYFDLQAQGSEWSIRIQRRGYDAEAECFREIDEISWNIERS